MFRFARWTALVLLICTLVVTPIRPAHAQDDAQAQLDATAAAMLALNSFHFKLETTAGRSVFQEAFELKIVEGDVVRPSNFQATLDVKLAIVDITLEVVSVDGNIWVKNPIGGSDSFIQVAGGDSDFELPPMELLNPDLLVPRALEYLEDPQIAGTEELDGQEMTVLTGTFDPSRLIGAGTPSTGDQVIDAATEPLDVKMWIDDQDRLVQVDFVGPLFSFEEGTGRLVRRVTFSNFDAEVSIEPPAQAS
jgi:hypothetical protein